jgi:hypothetical protein
LSIPAAFELNCTTNVNRKLTVAIHCHGVGGDIDEDSIICIYDEELRSPEKC